MDIEIENSEKINNDNNSMDLKRKNNEKKIIVYAVSTQQNEKKINDTDAIMTDKERIPDSIQEINYVSSSPINNTNEIDLTQINSDVTTDKSDFEFFPPNSDLLSSDI